VTMRAPDPVGITSVHAALPAGTIFQKVVAVPLMPPTKTVHVKFKGDVGLGLYTKTRVLPKESPTGVTYSCSPTRATTRIGPK
jgi:hypothetical protein